MNIGGFLPLSLIDYPGVPSAVIFTNGCNLRCPYCHNPALARGESPQFSEQEIRNFLIERAGKIQGVVISGGEPTLQPDLADWCRWLKSLGYLVKVDTNGQDTELIHDLFVEGVLDYVAADIKETYGHHMGPYGVDHQHYRSLIREMFERSFVQGEVRVTCVEPFIRKGDLANLIDDLRPDTLVYLQHCKVTPKIFDPEAFKSGKCVAWTPEEIQAFVDQYGREYNVKVR